MTGPQRKRRDLPVLRPERPPRWPEKPGYDPGPLSRKEQLQIAQARVMDAMELVAKHPDDASYRLALRARLHEREELYDRPDA